MPYSISRYQSALVSAVLLVFSAQAQAEVPHTFTPGDPAVAAHVNENFSDLDGRIVDLGQLVADQSNGIGVEIALDCDSDADAFRNAEINSHTTYILTGMCNGPIWIYDRSNVTIKGDDSGVSDKNDGVFLPANLDGLRDPEGELIESPYGAVGVWRSRNVRLENLKIDASNYVSRDYIINGFSARNIAALTSGQQAYVRAENVDFLGGDFALDIYSQSQLDIREGVTVTGFNRAGLSAFSSGVIIVHEDITVSGLVDTSTESYAQAIHASANGVVQIRNGGSFTGATTTETTDSSGFTIYPASVWISDNATLNISDSSNTAVFNGAFEAGYSAMIRVNGNTVIDGVLAAYHSSVIWMRDVTQSGGEVWAGDGGYMRVESSTLTPGDTDGYDINFELYRSGRARINNTTINLNGTNMGVWGYSVLNLRGSTSLGTDSIDCSDGRGLSIRDSVTLDRDSISCW